MIVSPAVTARVLVVDDAAASRATLCALLRAEGFRIVGDVATGISVINAIRQLNPEIVCLDYDLPDVDGLALLKQIRAEYPDVAVLVIAGESDDTLERTVADAGASGLIYKPFSAKSVLKEILQVAHAKQVIAKTMTSATGTTPPPRGKAVIADDNATMRLLLKAILERMGVEVVAEACDGQQAVEFEATLHPDFVCMDVSMPVMSGLDALAAILANNPAAKVIMVTSNSEREAILQAGSTGAKGYILKPYQPAKVIEAVVKLLR